MRNHKTRIERLIDNSTLKSTHYQIWMLSALGVFIDGLDLFIIAVTLPLIDYQFHLSKFELGLVGAASPLGAILGATLLGYMTDKMGRKKLYVGSMGLFVVFSLCSALAGNIELLILFRFLLGIGIGADYPISSSYLSEFMPRKIRARAVISAFSFQALGAMGGATIGLLTLEFYPNPSAWRWILGFTIIPATLIGIARMRLPESALWLQSKKEIKKASIVIAQVLERRVQDIEHLVRTDYFVQHTELQKKAFYHELFTKRFIHQTLLTSVPWFIMDICLYGVGIFSTMILASVFTKHEVSNNSLSAYISSSIQATQSSLFLDAFLVIGFIAAILTVKKLGTIRLQNLGFLGMTVALIILGFATQMQNGTFLVFIGFAIFNLMVNFGPNPTTYILPTERFPPYIRASGHGFAASSGKIGAAIGIFFLPIFIKTIGTSLSMFLLAGCALLGLICTAVLGRKPIHSGSHINTQSATTKHFNDHQLHQPPPNIPPSNNSINSSMQKIS